MLLISALNGVLPVNRAGAADQRQTGYPPFAEGLKPGQRLQAMVRSRLSGGESVVALDITDRGERHLLHMKLPAGTRPGDLLNLIFVSRDPRPAFMLMAANSATAMSVPLSEAGRFIDGLLRGPILPGSTTELSNAAPLLKGPPTDAVQLARNLAHALGRSGLFYESHQAQWISGTRPVAELMLEPQARLSQPPALPPHRDALSNSFAAALNGAPGTHEPVHPDALALVRQQLEIFETRHVSWQGVAWPGQTVEWEVAEEKPETADEFDQHRVAWNTRLNMTLPNLGRISASLQLDERGVEVEVSAADPVTAFMLRTGLMPLASKLESAGIKLLGMEVHLNE